MLKSVSKENKLRLVWTVESPAAVALCVWESDTCHSSRGSDVCCSYVCRPTRLPTNSRLLDLCRGSLRAPCHNGSVRSRGEQRACDGSTHKNPEARLTVKGFWTNCLFALVWIRVWSRNKIVNRRGRSVDKCTMEKRASAEAASLHITSALIWSLSASLVDN